MKRKLLSLIAMTAILTGCGTNQALDRFMDRLEFDEGQRGCVSVQGQVQVGGNPFATSTIMVNMHKTQGDDVPDCR